MSGPIRILKVPILFVAIAYCLFATTVFAQTISAPQLRDDLHTVRKHILAVHPNPFYSATDETFESKFNEIEMSLEGSYDRVGAFRILSKLTSSILDRNTYISLPATEFENDSEGNLTYPVEVIFIDGRLIVKKKHNSLQPGTQILSINDLSIPELVSEFSKVISAPRSPLGLYGLLFEELYWAVKGPKEVFELQITSGELKHTVSIHGLNHSVSTQAENLLDLHIPENQQSVTLKVYSYDQIDLFSKQLDLAMNQLSALAIPTLTIDLRGAKGDSAEAAQLLLSRLTDTPLLWINSAYAKNSTYFPNANHSSHNATAAIEETNNRIAIHERPMSIASSRSVRFTGPMSVLLDSETSKIGAVFAAAFQCNRLGSVVGTAPDLSSRHFTDPMSFYLIHTGLTLNISALEVEAACASGDGRIVTPEYRLSYTDFERSRDMDWISRFAANISFGAKSKPGVLKNFWSQDSYFAKWTEVVDNELVGFLEQINPIDGVLDARPETTRVFWRKLPFYDSVALIGVTDSSWSKNENLVIYYLTDRGNLFRLNGTSPPIHEVNAKAPVNINSKNVIDYLKFYTFFVHGDEGPFFLAENIYDPFMPSFDSQTTMSIGKAIGPAIKRGKNEQNHFLVGATIFYGKSVFEADFAVHPTGMVEMLKDEPILKDLPATIDRPLRPLTAQIKTDEGPTDPQ